MGMPAASPSLPASRLPPAAPLRPVPGCRHPRRRRPTPDKPLPGDQGTVGAIAALRFAAGSAAVPAGEAAKRPQAEVTG
jgi:hypothetical protein